MKIVVVVFGSVIVLIAGVLWLMDYSERSESHFQTYRELEQSELVSKGWVPAFIPESAYDIHEKHRADQPYVNVQFRFKPGDTKKIEASCAVASSTDAQTTTYRCKDTDGNLVVQLTNDGTGRIASD